MIQNSAEIIRMFLAADVKCLLIGGQAAIAHGVARVTFDVDFVYARDRENLQRIIDLLAPLHPYLRGAPPGLPFRLDMQTLRNGLNFTLTTDIGHIDLLGEVTGGGTYEELLPFCGTVTHFGLQVPCTRLDKLIALKRAAGRPKDLEMLAELEALREESSQLPPTS